MKPQKKIDIENSLNDIKRIKKRFEELWVQKEYLVEALKYSEKCIRRAEAEETYKNCVNPNIGKLTLKMIRQALIKAGE